MAVRFDNNNNYPPITLPPLQTTVEIEEHRKNTTFDQNYNSLYYRQSSAQNINIKINEIANEVPRVELENIKLPDMKEIYVNQWYINIFINTLIFSINKGSYILTGV